ncbi:MAG: PucR family transcriptional regulator ligand-binding domain-containing protein [Streptosporangiaceae bacterium]|nr:PucR family transcriptional regulator ligand-binding domain-containing protein [Streptosporangiaceae bacterium]MBV9856696.1 PucR family transcriptional regulator ligand-binding domain-containing protein [Streptosporangiaceae bacterium]
MLPTALPTVSDLLGLDVLRQGSPRVVAGADRTGAPVRWVHVIELADAARLLRGGEFVLTTGIALPDDPSLLARYATDLAAAGVSALAIELGRRYVRELPGALIRAAEECGMPLIAFEREVQFVEITEAVHASIIDAQLEELRAAERLHEVFTELSVAGASPDEVVRQAAALAGRPVILADLSHRVLACAPGSTDPGRLLAGFATRSRAVQAQGRTVYDEASGWLVTTVGARGEDWGRVILVCDGPPSGTDTVLIERAATTLALGRLLARHQESIERQAHRTLISGIMNQADPAEAAVRARALGVPVEGRQLIAMVLRLRGHGPGISADARVLEVADATADACQALRVPSLVGTLDDARAGAMLSLGPRVVADDMLTTLVTRIRERLGDNRDGLVIGVGETAGSVRQVRRSFLEASQVADVADDDARLPFYRLPDLRLRGLLHLLRDDPRLQAFAERELGPLLDRAPGLMGTLAAYLAAGGNKAAAAKDSHLARPTFYERLRRIERILGTDLASAESRTSLHVAMLALETGQTAQTARAGQTPRRARAGQTGGGRGAPAGGTSGTLLLTPGLAREFPDCVSFGR